MLSNCIEKVKDFFENVSDKLHQCVLILWFFVTLFIALLIKFYEKVTGKSTGLL